MFNSVYSALTTKAVSLQYHCEDLIIPRANYRSHLRRVSTNHSTMPINVQDLPAKEVNVLNKYTGFPEPLSPGIFPPFSLLNCRILIGICSQIATQPSPTPMQTRVPTLQSKQKPTSRARILEARFCIADIIARTLSGREVLAGEA